MSGVEVNTPIQLWCDEHRNEAVAAGKNVHAMAALMIPLMFAKVLEGAESAEAAAAAFTAAMDTPMCCHLTDEERAGVLMEAPETSGDDEQDQFVSSQYVPGERVHDHDV